MERLDPNSFSSYLPISDEVFHGGIYVTSAGCQMVPPGADYPPVRHPNLYHFSWEEGRVLPDFGLVLISAGGGIFESKATGRIEIKAEMGFLLFPGVWHRYRPNPKTGWTEKWIQFNGVLAHALRDRAAISPEDAVLCFANPQAVIAAMDEFQARVCHNPLSISLRLSLHALSVVTLALGLNTRSVKPITGAKHPSASDDDLVATALDYIWTRSHHVLSVQDIVNVLGVPRRTLDRKMSMITGHSLLDEIINCRFNRAERLLRETQLPIKTIVRLAGFGSEENMRQVFLSRTQVAPRQHRKQS